MFHTRLIVLIVYQVASFISNIFQIFTCQVLFLVAYSLQPCQNKKKAQVYIDHQHHSLINDSDQFLGLIIHIYEGKHQTKS